jgi:hypothetical protein
MVTPSLVMVDAALERLAGVPGELQDLGHVGVVLSGLRSSVRGKTETPWEPGVRAPRA